MDPEELRAELRRCWDSTGDVNQVVERLWKPEGRDGRAQFHCKPLKQRGKDPAWSAEVLWAPPAEENHGEVESVVVDIDWEPATVGPTEVPRQSVSLDLFSALPADIELASLAAEFSGLVKAATEAGWKVRALSVGG